MLKTRVIPVLLLRNKGLVKGVKFKDYTYIGDPINAVKIFNTKEVPELLFLDILATREKKSIPMELVTKIADECYMPFGVGGGIHSISQIKELLYNGVEKVSINTAAVENPNFIKEASRNFGNQCVVVSIDVKKKWTGTQEVVTHSGTRKTGLDPVAHARKMEELGAGELLVTSIDRDGIMQGYDIALLRKIADAVSIPVIAGGGAWEFKDFVAATREGHASAVAAGSYFVYHGRRKGILINFPKKEELDILQE